MEQHGLVMVYTGNDKGKTTCAGCRLNRNGRCQDRADYGKDGGDLLTNTGAVCAMKPALPLLWPQDRGRGQRKHEE